MISRGKIEQVYSLGEPTCVPHSVHFLPWNIWLLFCPLQLWEVSKSPHSEFKNLKHYTLHCSHKSVMMLSGLRTEIIMNICLIENVCLNPNRGRSLRADEEWYCHWNMVRCSYCNLKDKALNPCLGVQASPNTPRVSMSPSLSLSEQSQSQGPVLSRALLPLSLWVQIKARRVPAQLSAEESDREKEREGRAGNAF